MNRADFLEFHNKFTQQMRAICERKNADYAGSDGTDPFANFTRVEAMGIATTEVGFLTRMTDKLSRLATFATSGKLAVTDESATDTLLDLANYAVLLAGFIASREQPVVPKATETLWAVFAKGKYTREGYAVGFYDDREIAERMAKTFHARTWSEPNYTLTVEEVDNVGGAA